MKDTAARACTSCNEPFPANARKDKVRCTKCVKKAANARWNAENRDKKKTDAARYRAENVEYDKERQARWYRENPDYGVRYRAENADAIKAYTARYRAEHADAIKVEQARYRAENPDYWTQWKSENPDKVQNIHRTRRAKKNNAEGSYTDADFKRICEAQGNRCAHCGIESNKLHADHIIAIGHGFNHAWNIQGLCQGCNSRKSNRIHLSDLFTVALRDDSLEPLNSTLKGQEALARYHASAPPFNQDEYKEKLLNHEVLLAGPDFACSSSATIKQ